MVKYLNKVTVMRVCERVREREGEEGRDSVILIPIIRDLSFPSFSGDDVSFKDLCFCHLLHLLLLLLR